MFQNISFSKTCFNFMIAHNSAPWQLNATQNLAQLTKVFLALIFYWAQQ